MKSTSSELSKDVSHDAESELCQKLLTEDYFPRRLLIGNILETVNAITWNKNFFYQHLKGNPLVSLLNATFNF